MALFDKRDLGQRRDFAGVGAPDDIHVSGLAQDCPLRFAQVQPFIGHQPRLTPGTQ
jgi:hypothetical protein